MKQNKTLTELTNDGVERSEKKEQKETYFEENDYKFKVLTMEQINEIEGEITYIFKNKYILEQAFIRKSYANEHNIESNEALEFIGDEALDCVVTKQMIDSQFSFNNELKCITLNGDVTFDRINDGTWNTTAEEWVTNSKKNRVCGKNLASSMNRTNLMKYLIINQADVNNNVKENDSIKEDLLEAIIGAVTLDCNWDFDTISRVVDNLVINPDLEASKICSEITDVITEFTKWHIKEFKSYPVYSFEELNDEHKCSISFIYNGKKMEFEGTGSSKSKAKYNCCRHIYDNMFKEYDPKTIYENDTIKEYVEKLNLNNSINLLQELNQKGIICNLQYNIQNNKFDENGNPLWEGNIECIFRGKHIGFIRTSNRRSKKDCKSWLAWLAIKFLSEFIYSLPCDIMEEDPDSVDLG